LSSLFRKTNPIAAKQHKQVKQAPVTVQAPVAAFPAAYAKIKKA
jgi:hypothetical protein